MAEATRLELEWLPGHYTICQLPAGVSTPAWVLSPGRFGSVTQTDAECSIIAPSECVPEEIQAERGWVALRIVGPLPFDTVGVLARLAGALAAAEVPLCAISTYDTDILMIKADQASRAASALAEVASLPSPPPSSSSAI